MMKIEMARGDIHKQRFTLLGGDGQPYVEPLDNIYFTVKENAKDREYKFQKRMSDDDIVWVDSGTYQFTIMPDDTNNLKFGEYDCDIEIVRSGTLKKTFLGKLIIGREVTHAYNEGGA